MSIFIAFIIGAIASAALTYGLLSRSKETVAPTSSTGYKPDEVAKYYDEVTDKYLEIYGEVIQALRPPDTAELLDHTIKNAGLEPGQLILDAGCGVGGPAMHFASKVDLKIEGLTVSGVQATKGTELIAERGLSDKITLKKGDFHQLDQFYPGNSFDMVLFLESLGHANQPGIVIQAAQKVLKENGFIYIKDFFTREVADPEFAKRNARVVQLMNEGYNYNVLDLHPTLTQLRKAGFHIVKINRPGYENDVRVRTEFETDQNIDLWDGQTEWLPVEWLEIKCQKCSW